MSKLTKANDTPAAVCESALKAAKTGLTDELMQEARETKFATTVQGDRAFVKAIGGGDDAVGLKRLNGRWYIARGILGPLEGPLTRRSDMAAQKAVRNTVTLVEACGARTGIYRKCKPLRREYIGPTGDATAETHFDGFKATATSDTGTRFNITRSDLNYVQSCSPAGAGLCQANGSW
ncbi:hypothetical protein DSM112329_02834 [Paraconexibacter sp. AEG42_29]|uniref:Uncharacterized protein n=2 Tax=Paraconexibacter sp. AEG42_29 TaxID=2997339 RepID=A0AAU7AWA7_9ACTN